MNVAVDRALCFADAKGRPSPRVEKQATKHLERAGAVLDRVLEPEERVVGVVTACAPFSVLEFLTTGWIITAMKRCLLVVTDRRLLQLPTKSNWTPRGNVAQIRFADLESAKVVGWAGKKLVLEYRGGKKETFTGLGGAAVKRLGEQLSEQAGQGEPSVDGGRHFICPQCAHSLAGAEDSCTQCGFAFRSRKKALRYSLVFPGGGYFYTGHPVMGVLDGLVEGFLLLVIVPGVFMAIAGEPDMWLGLGVLSAALAFEKLITVYHAGHYASEFLPAKSQPSASTQPS